MEYMCIRQQEEKGRNSYLPKNRKQLQVEDGSGRKHEMRDSQGVWRTEKDATTQKKFK